MNGLKSGTIVARKNAGLEAANELMRETNSLGIKYNTDTCLIAAILTGIAEELILINNKLDEFEKSVSTDKA